MDTPGEPDPPHTDHRSGDCHQLGGGGGGEVRGATGAQLRGGCGVPVVLLGARRRQVMLRVSECVLLS